MSLSARGCTKLFSLIATLALLITLFVFDPSLPGFPGRAFAQKPVKCGCYCGILLNPPCSESACKSACGWRGGGGEQQPAIPFLTDFNSAQSAVSRSLQSYRDQNRGNIAGDITQYLIGRMPNANPRTLDELDQAAEDLAQFFEGYRQAYEEATRRVADAEQELTKNRETIVQLDTETKKLNLEVYAAKNEWERRGGPELFEQLKRVRMFRRDLNVASRKIAQRLLKEIYSSPYRDVRVWSGVGSPEELSRSVGITDGMEEFEALQLETKISMFGIVASADEAQPRMSRFSNELPRVSLNRSQHATPEGRIRENLGYIKVARLTEAIGRYATASSIGQDPAALLLAHARSKGAVVDARNALREARAAEHNFPSVDTINNYFIPKMTMMNDQMRRRLAVPVRWGFWKYLEEAVAPLLAEQMKSPKMLVRFGKVQEEVVKFAQKDIGYLPEAARVLASGSPQDIERVRRNMDAALCEFAVQTETKIFPLPKPFNETPFGKLFPPKPSCE